MTRQYVVMRKTNRGRETYVKVDRGMEKGGEGNGFVSAVKNH